MKILHTSKLNAFKPLTTNLSNVASTRQQMIHHNYSTNRSKLNRLILSQSLSHFSARKRKPHRRRFERLFFSESSLGRACRRREWIKRFSSAWDSSFILIDSPMLSVHFVAVSPDEVVFLPDIAEPDELFLRNPPPPYSHTDSAPSIPQSTPHPQHFTAVSPSQHDGLCVARR
jgi:hypothetical protein